MSVSLYEVEYKNLNYTRSLEEKELDFFEGFRNQEDGTFYIDEELLDEEIKAHKEDGKESEIPQDLTEFLRQKIKESEHRDLIISISY